MLSFDEALERILGVVPLLAKSRVSLADAAFRVLAQEVRAPSPLPAWDASAMDGYAVRTRDCAGEGPFRLGVSGESRAGVPLDRTLDEGACRIFTGAVLPKGADAVVLQEDVRREGDEIEFTERPAPFQNVRRAGEDLAAGSVAVPAGTRLGAFHLGLLAALDQTEVLVGASPRVAFLATGAELRAAGDPPRAGTIPESNSIALATLARRAGAVVVDVRRTADELEGTERVVAELLGGCDVLVTIGGVSVGDHDVVKAALERAGVVLEFWKVAIKPGKPLVFGRRGSTVVLGLPGNPVSAQVTFSLFGLPLLGKMQGLGQLSPRLRRLPLAATLRQAKGRRGFHRVRVDHDGVHLLSGQSSGSVCSMAWADGLAILPETESQAEAGTLVDVLLFADL